MGNGSSPSATPHSSYGTRTSPPSTLYGAPPSEFSSVSNNGANPARIPSQGYGTPPASSPSPNTSSAPPSPLVVPPVSSYGPPPSGSIFPGIPPPGPLPASSPPGGPLMSSYGSPPPSRPDEPAPPAGMQEPPSSNRSPPRPSQSYGTPPVVSPNPDVQGNQNPSVSSYGAPLPISPNLPSSLNYGVRPATFSSSMLSAPPSAPEISPISSYGPPPAGPVSAGPSSDNNLDPLFPPISLSNSRYDSSPTAQIIVEIAAAPSIPFFPSESSYGLPEPEIPDLPSPQALQPASLYEASATLSQSTNYGGPPPPALPAFSYGAPPSISPALLPSPLTAPGYSVLSAGLPAATSAPSYGAPPLGFPAYAETNGAPQAVPQSGIYGATENGGMSSKAKPNFMFTIFYKISLI